ncbi:hypothetical protein WN55_02590 [Dufourea novaeangliae]|uniref:Endonuclease/exonuclease/phosphatase domain-containing protein n=1 Tax=Dufourea novaeangliae TaxID=178035 RepID=A0A154PHK5_DUFNO|nr:hypothetical protein WN55_02590 [Dufourea novaeangliae]
MQKKLEDFNVTIGSVGGEVWGRKLCRYLEERGWEILNGCVKGDEEGELTYTGARGNSVIDYIIGNEDTRGRVKRIKVEEKVDSDHHPVTVWVKEEKRKVKERRKKGEGKIGNWTEEGREAFIKNFGKSGRGERGVEEEWRELKSRIEQTIGKREKREDGGTKNVRKKKVG